MLWIRNNLGRIRNLIYKVVSGSQLNNWKTFKHFKDFLRIYICNQRKIGPFLRKISTNLIDFLVKKVRSGTGADLANKFGSDRIRIHNNASTVKRILNVFACTDIFYTVLTQLVRQVFSPKRNRSGSRERDGYK